VNLLLDTHTLLWWLDDNPTLSVEARDAIADGSEADDRDPQPRHPALPRSHFEGLKRAAPIPSHRR
jgi:hypothetical protein